MISSPGMMQVTQDIRSRVDSLPELKGDTIGPRFLRSSQASGAPIRTIPSLTPNSLSMISTEHQFDPLNDTCLLTFQRHEDEEGNPLDIDTSIYLSRTGGYYVQEKKAQHWMGRCWENATTDLEDSSEIHARRRILECPCSPITPEQVISIVVNQFVPEEGGALALVLGILNQHGIH